MDYTGANQPNKKTAEKRMNLICRFFFMKKNKAKLQKNRLKVEKVVDEEKDTW